MTTARQPSPELKLDDLFVLGEYLQSHSMWKTKIPIFGL